MNIYQKMAAITADLQTIAKNLTVEVTKGKGYKAVSERDIIDAVKPLEAKHGVYSYPSSREILESQTLESESTWEGKTTKKTSFFSRIMTVYRFVNVDEPSDYIETVTFAEGIDSQDKGSGKAMTYADKYALMKAYKISTGDDPDQNASEDKAYTPANSGSPKGPYGKGEPASEISCEACNQPITPYNGRTPAQIAEGSMKMFSKKLCARCSMTASKNDKEVAPNDNIRN